MCEQSSGQGWTLWWPAVVRGALPACVAVKFYCHTSDGDDECDLQDVPVSWMVRTEWTGKQAKQQHDET